MRKIDTRGYFIISAIYFAAFIVFTCFVSFYDVSSSGVNGTNIGFSTLNTSFHEFTGVNMPLYDLTNVIGVGIFVLMAFFAFLTVMQSIVRRSVKEADTNLLLVCLFYVLLLIVYFVFEKIVINYRPILMDGQQEASYPSSHTMLALCVLITAIIQFNRLFRGGLPKYIAGIILIALAALMVICRMWSGVHWFTDIIGGGIISISLIFFYCGFLSKFEDSKYR